MPRFLAFAKLSILRHVAYAYGVLPSTCSLCGEGQEHATLSRVCKIKHITPCRLRLWRFASYLLIL